MLHHWIRESLCSHENLHSCGLAFFGVPHLEVNIYLPWVHDSGPNGSHVYPMIDEINMPSTDVKQTRREMRGNREEERSPSLYVWTPSHLYVVIIEKTAFERLVWNKGPGGTGGKGSFSSLEDWWSTIRQGKMFIVLDTVSNELHKTKTQFLYSKYKVAISTKLSAAASNIY